MLNILLPDILLLALFSCQEFLQFFFVHARGGTPKGECSPQAFPTPTKLKKKNTSCRHDDMKYFTDLPFSQNQPLKSAD